MTKEEAAYLAMLPGCGSCDWPLALSGVEDIGRRIPCGKCGEKVLEACLGILRERKKLNRKNKVS